MILSLPPEFLKELKQAAVIGDVSKTRELAESISESNPEITKAIKKLANEYRLDTIFKMLE